MNLENLVQDNYLFFDGAFGTMLQKENLIELGESPPVLNLISPKEITKIHKLYKEAGADIATTNTFEANRFKLVDSDYSVAEVVKAAIDNAKNSGSKYIALDIGPTGELLRPTGELSFNEAYDAFKEIVEAGEGADLILLETFSDILELKAALLAAKENSDLPVITTMTYSADNRTFMGTDPITATLTLQALGADAVGVNCSLGPEELYPVVEQIVSVAQVPVIVQANAGLPQIVNGESVYSIDKDSYADAVERLAELGVSIVGGCCGTTPDYIRELKNRLGDKKPERKQVKTSDALTSATQTVYLDQSAVPVGERINPTGKPELKSALINKIYDPILREAVLQQNAGAGVLDINVGIPDIDESQVLPEVITDVTSVSSLPLQIDTTKPKALEEALRVYPGIPIINSVNGKEESLETVLPLVKKYGAYVIGLTLDEEGLPKTKEKRLEIAKKIIDRAGEYGIEPYRIIIDPLCLTLSTDQSQGEISLETIKTLKEDYGVKTTLGISNISFGLPQRDSINAHYLTRALEAGINVPIVDVTSEAISDVLAINRIFDSTDQNAQEFIKTHQNIEKKPEVIVESDDLIGMILEGRKDDTRNLVEVLLQEKDGEELVNEYFIPALDIIGKRYESGEIFLPQLMQSAGAVKEGFEVIKKNTDQERPVASRGKILLATVKGDIHDIGKNIVKMMLENYGFEVHDLGNDVDSIRILDYLESNEIGLIGLSALMTTTVESMEETIKAVQDSGFSGKIMVGGAVLTKDYAEKIGADYYGQDAQTAVEIAQEYFKG